MHYVPGYVSSQYNTKVLNYHRNLFIRLTTGAINNVSNICYLFVVHKSLCFRHQLTLFQFLGWDTV